MQCSHRDRYSSSPYGHCGKYDAFLPLELSLTCFQTEKAGATATADCNACLSAGGVVGTASAKNVPQVSSSGPVVVLSTMTVMPVPASSGSPFGNGTHPAATGGSSSGFHSGVLSKAKATGTAHIAPATETIF